MGNHQNPSLEPPQPSCSNKQCLQCGESLAAYSDNNQTITCQNCNAEYPVLLFGDISIPLIFEDVDSVLFGWGARFNGFKEKIDLEISTIAKQVTDKKYSNLTRQRLKKVLSAKKHYKEQLTSLLTSIEEVSGANQLPSNISIAKNQGIDSYINNIFRDWSWDNGENLELLESVSDVLVENYHAGNTLTLGAGASRLSYDFHYTFKANFSTLVDINPVLLGFAANIISGNTLELEEFPIAPLSLDSFAVNQTCELPINNNHKANEFEFILADALNCPFEHRSFDTVLTPWLIDIVPIDFRDLIPHINRLLEVGGVWVNTGSLAFFHNNQVCNYSQEEITDLLIKYGFDEINISRKNINYLHSPYSAHGRVEMVFSFSARKKFECKPPVKFSYVPKWLRDYDLNIPVQDEMVDKSSKYLFQAQILSAIDGNRTIREIGELVATQYEIDEESACAAVKQVLLDNRA